ncbi:hypothetical protein HNP24_000455 [Chryseobacterium sediminis]|uniref:Transposase n=1 Tax=Chryseobacterium sediminis TaxID=1679494 RepID=A0ABR6PUX8_9FLAO|nr:hypothetical protein [Chryseobacterium sediminis]
MSKYIRADKKWKKKFTDLPESILCLLNIFTKSMMFI